MTDLDKALSEIANILCSLAASTLFQGFGPMVIAASAVLAFAAGVAQTLWPEIFADGPLGYIHCWVAVGLIAGGLIATETIARCRRRHGGMADAMLLNALKQFLPAGLAGAAIAGVLTAWAPDSVWLLPGLWQILLAMGICAAASILPRAMLFVALGYGVSGMAVLILTALNRELTPWLMAAPFTIGQLATAYVVHTAQGEPS